MSGPDSLELALEMKKKERKIEKWPFFEHLILACTIDLMNGLGLVRSIGNLLEIPIFTLEISQSYLFLRYFGICNVP